MSEGNVGGVRVEQQVGHVLKILPSFFAEVISGKKTFEIRKNDRNFQVGDWLYLHEWDGDFTGGVAYAKVTYITDYHQRAGYVVMAISLFEPREP